MRPNTLLLVSIIMLAFAIVLGAFGAHAWQNTLLQFGTSQIFTTASQYHFYIALSLLSLAVYAHQPESVSLTLVSWLLICGLIIFSGSLYILALTNIRWLGAITPIGGTLLFMGFVMLAFQLFKNKKLFP